MGNQTIPMTWGGGATPEFSSQVLVHFGCFFSGFLRWAAKDAKQGVADSDIFQMAFGTWWHDQAGSERKLS